MPPRQAMPPSRSADPRGSRHVSRGTHGNLDKMCATCSKPSQWGRSSLTLSTRPPQTQSPSTASSFPATPRSKTKPSPPPTPLAANQSSSHSSRHKQFKEQRGEVHGRRELIQRRRAQARRGGAAGRLLGGEAGAGRRAQQGACRRRGPARRAPGHGGRVRRHLHHRVVGQGRSHRRVPREEQGQQGAERQEEACHQRRQLRARLHRGVRQLQVPLQLHRLPGPRQAEESAVHQRRPGDRVRGQGEVQVRLQRFLEVVIESKRALDWPSRTGSEGLPLAV